TILIQRDSNAQHCGSREYFALLLDSSPKGMLGLWHGRKLFATCIRCSMEKSTASRTSLRWAGERSDFTMNSCWVRTELLRSTEDGSAVAELAKRSWASQPKLS